MSIRLVLAAVLGAGLIAAAMPVVESAQQARADRAVDERAVRLAAAIEQMARRNDPVPPGVAGARRRVRIDVPDADREGPWMTVGTIPAGVERLAPEADSPRTDVLSTLTGGESPRLLPVDTDVRIVRDGTICADGAGLSIHEDTVLMLGYVIRNGTPSVTVTREFTSENGTTPGHAG
ncbi:MAG: hypothetical protein ABEJ27_03710 [Halodesulfurarchaeum sp.]